MDCFRSLLHQPRDRMTTKSSSDWRRTLTATIYLAHPEPPYEPPEVPIKWTLKRRLFLHFIIIGCERRLRFLRNLPRREEDTLVGRVLSQNRYNWLWTRGLKRHGLWTSVYDGHRIAHFGVSRNLYNNGFYIETMERVARSRESCLFRSKIHRRGRYQGGLVEQGRRCHSSCRSGDYDYYANNVLWVIVHWCPTPDRGDRVTQVFGQVLRPCRRPLTNYLP